MFEMGKSEAVGSGKTFLYFSYLKRKDIDGRAFAACRLKVHRKDVVWRFSERIQATQEGTRKKKKKVLRKSEEKVTCDPVAFR